MIEVCVVGVYFICASVSSIMKIFIDPVSDELGEAFDDKPYLSLTQSFLPRVSCRLIVWPLLTIIMLFTNHGRVFCGCGVVSESAEVINEDYSRDEVTKHERSGSFQTAPILATVF